MGELSKEDTDWQAAEQADRAAWQADLQRRIAEDRKAVRAGQRHTYYTPEGKVR